MSRFLQSFLFGSPSRARIWLASLISVVLLVGQAAAESGPLRVQGRSFVDRDGRAVQLKGINLGNWLMQEGYMFKFRHAKSPREIEAAFERLLGPAAAGEFWRSFRQRYVTQADIAFIKAQGFNLVRVPLHWKLFMTAEGRFEGEGWSLIERLLGWAESEGLWVVLDLHAAPGGQTGVNHDDGSGYPLMFYVPRHRDRTVALWRELAARFRQSPVLIGYDLLNEPIAPYHDVNLLNPKLEPMYQRIVAAIREVDPHRIIFLAGAQWSSSFAMLGPPFAPNLAYTHHAFWASTRRDAIQRHLNFAARWQVPLLLGESGEADDEWNDGFRRLHERHGIGWVFWTYKNLDTPSTVVSIPLPQGWPEIAAFADRRGPRPADVTVVRAITQYLAGLELANGNIRHSYIASLGLGSAR